MIKVLGALLLVMGTIGFSIEKVNERKRELHNLIQIKNFSGYLLGEIKYTHIPIPDACEEHLGRVDGLLKEILESVCTTFKSNEGKSFDAIWEEVVKEKCGQNKLLKEEKTQLSRLCNCFGFCNTNMQLSALEKYMQDLENLVLQKEKKFQDSKKLIIYFGVMSGLFLSIMLL